MKPGNILFFTEGVNFILKNKKLVRSWILNCIEQESGSFDSLNFIFCKDEYLHQLNMSYLGHDTFTDILTFNNADKGDDISGDIFISTDRVRENAEKFQTTFLNELHRVMIHGVLHLLGYHDSSEKQRKVMRRKEDYCLSLRPFFE